MSFVHQNHDHYYYVRCFSLPVVDPGFPRGGGANSPVGRQHTILPNFPKNYMKLKEFGPQGGARPKFTM